MRPFLRLLPLLLLIAACDNIIDVKLKATASEINKSCPMIVDKETRLDNAVALPGKVLRYRYTILNYTRNQIDTNVLKASMQPGIVENVRTSPDMKYFRENKVNIEFYYKDKNGAYLMLIAVKPQ